MIWCFRIIHPGKICFHYQDGFMWIINLDENVQKIISETYFTPYSLN